ncbi:Hypothetical predicted protein [Mytilus galloprovincialis]|uniref:Uncharacterized protein n=1 Tax=Mytilus galloprovincialis TaxID=29158 RepID=A0A8B6EVP3_MYTGA|nr:Hypothetical predicted protein [Mytilus galloprovincialis]
MHLRPNERRTNTQANSKVPSKLVKQHKDLLVNQHKIPLPPQPSEISPRTSYRQVTSLPQNYYISDELYLDSNINTMDYYGYSLRPAWMWNYMPYRVNPERREFIRMCGKCGKQHTNKSLCAARNSKCFKCQKPGHFCKRVFI